MIEIGPVELHNMVAVRCVLGQDVDDAVKHAQACYADSPINSGVNVERRFLGAGVLEWHDNVQIQHDAKQEGHGKSQKEKDVCKFSCLNTTCA